MQLRGILRSRKCAKCGRKLRFFHRKVKGGDGSILCLACSEVRIENEIQTERETIGETEPSIMKETVPETLPVKKEDFKENDGQLQSIIAQKSIDISITSKKNHKIEQFSHDWEREKAKNLLRRSNRRKTS